MLNIELESVLGTTQILAILQVFAALGSCFAALISLFLVLRTNKIQTNSFTTDYCNNILKSSVSNILSYNSNHLYDSISSCSQFGVDKVREYYKITYLNMKKDMLEIEALMTLLSKNNLLDDNLVKNFFTASFEKVVARKIYLYIVVSKTSYYLYLKHIKDNNYSYFHTEKLVFTDNFFNLSDECLSSIYDYELDVFIKRYKKFDFKNKNNEVFFDIFKLFFESRSTFNIKSYKKINDLVSLISSKLDKNYIDKLINEVLVDISNGTYAYPTKEYTTSKNFKKLANDIIELLKKAQVNPSKDDVNNNIYSQNFQSSGNDYIDLYNFYEKEDNFSQQLSQSQIDDVLSVLSCEDPEDIKSLAKNYDNINGSDLWLRLYDLAVEKENDSNI